MVGADILHSRSGPDGVSAAVRPSSTDEEEADAAESIAFAAEDELDVRSIASTEEEEADVRSNTSDEEEVEEDSLFDIKDYIAEVEEFDNNGYSGASAQMERKDIMD